MNDVIIKRFEKGMKSVWDSFVINAKNPLFMFQREYMDYHSDRFVDHSLMFYNEGQLIAVMPCSELEGRLISHGGLTYGGMITDKNMRQTLMICCFDSLDLYCQKNSIVEIIYKSIPALYHIQPAEEDTYAMYQKGYKLYKVEPATVINLSDPIKMSKIRQRQIKKSISEGIEVVVDDSKNAYNSFINKLDDILVKYHNTHAVHTGEEMYLLHERFPSSIHLYIAKRADDIIGGSVVFVYKDVVHTQYLCATDEGRKVGALDATIEKIIEDYTSSKKWLDFGISSEAQGLVLNEGLINQKEGFGGRTQVYYTWKRDFL